MASVKTPGIEFGLQLPGFIGYFQRRFGRLAARHRFLIANVLALSLTILVMGQVLNAYNRDYQLFEEVVLSSSVKVDAAEKAIQYIANVNKYAADYIAAFDDLTKRSDAYVNLQLNFAKFRDQLFTLREGLRDVQDTKEFLAAEQKVYEKYWGSVNTLLVARQNGDMVTSLATYEKIDDLLENLITPTLQKIEKLNFDGMVVDKTQATSIIYSQLAVVGGIGIGLAVLLTFISFWLRFKVKRYLTPGTDIAAILAWGLAIILIMQLLVLPNEFKTMVQDSYYSISDVSRVLAAANQAHRTESAMLNDPANAQKWQDKFDSYVGKLHLIMCGQPVCLQNTFSVASNADIANPAQTQAALKISDQNAALIDNVKPLMANITFPGEVRALEKARVAYNDYLKYDAQMRSAIQSKDLAAAFKINAGGSAQAFTKFVDAMQEERLVNQQMFDSVWEREKSALSLYPLVLGVGGYSVLILFVIGGLFHRYGEL